MAWLNTAPQVKKKTGSETDEKQRTRLEGIRDDGRDPYYPQIECGMHLINYLFEMGPACSSGTGSIPMTHAEIQAWQSGVGIRLQPWEYRFVRRLSSDYLSSSQDAEEIDCPSPCGIEDSIDRDYVASKLKNALGGRVKKE